MMIQTTMFVHVIGLFSDPRLAFFKASAGRKIDLASADFLELTHVRARQSLAKEPQTRDDRLILTMIIRYEERDALDFLKFDKLEWNRDMITKVRLVKLNRLNGLHVRDVRKSKIRAIRKELHGLRCEIIRRCFNGYAVELDHFSKFNMNDQLFYYFKRRVELRNIHHVDILFDLPSASDFNTLCFSVLNKLVNGASEHSFKQ